MTINFEEDQQRVIRKTDNIQSLADQVEKLEDLQKRLELQEDNLKNTKKQIDHLFRVDATFYLESKCNVNFDSEKVTVNEKGGISSKGTLSIVGLPGEYDK